MKKRIVVVSAISLCALLLTACGGAGKGTVGMQNIVKAEEITAEEKTDMNTQLSGGWAVAEDSSITDDRMAVFEKATETLTGAVFTPVSYLGSQVVAGTNHAFLCRSEPSVSELQGGYEWVILYIYQDLSGNCEMLQTTPLTLGIQ